jgi:hypothetical protein
MAVVSHNIKRYWQYDELAFNRDGIHAHTHIVTARKDERIYFKNFIKSDQCINHINKR